MKNIDPKGILEYYRNPPKTANSPIKEMRVLEKIDEVKKSTLIKDLMFSSDESTSQDSDLTDSKKSIDYDHPGLQSILIMRFIANMCQKYQNQLELEKRQGDEV